MSRALPGASDKQTRQRAILDAVADGDLATQSDIVRTLSKRGIHAAQASVSRDIVELGLVKAGGVYRTAPAGVGVADPELPLRTWVRAVEAAGPNLVVVRCDPGTAQGVARALDVVRPRGVVGTVAGDDTIFVAMRTTKDGTALSAYLDARISRRE